MHKVNVAGIPALSKSSTSIASLPSPDTILYGAAAQRHLDDLHEAIKDANKEEDAPTTPVKGGTP